MQTTRGFALQIVLCQDLQQEVTMSQYGMQAMQLFGFMVVLMVWRSKICGSLILVKGVGAIFKSTTHLLPELIMWQPGMTPIRRYGSMQGMPVKSCTETYGDLVPATPRGH